MEQTVEHGLAGDLAEMTNSRSPAWLSVTICGPARNSGSLSGRLSLRLKTEPVGDELSLRVVAVVHATDLRQADVRFVHDDEVPLRVWNDWRMQREIDSSTDLARFSAVEMERVVLHRLAVIDFPQHSRSYSVFCSKR